MRTRFVAALVAALALLPGTAAAHKCGMAVAAQNKRQKASMQVTLARTPNACSTEEYYDSVYTRETEHFQIFYTLDYGPHATTPEFVDSLAASLESAYTFHTKTMGMRAPQGLDTTSHFLKPVKNGLYPVEVAEIDFLRDPTYVLSASACNGCFGVTYPSKKDHSKSAIIIDNDFRYVPDNSTKMDTIRISGKDCPYPDASVPIYSKAYGFSYTDEWAKGIRITAFHELFHAVQLQYTDLYNYWTYWAEASATANEELGAPDVDDYFFYISSFILSTETPLDVIGYKVNHGKYAISLLYLYLYGNIDKHFDKEIWENFKKKPDTSFESNLIKLLEKRGLTADSVFHDFVTRLALSGEKTKTVDKKLWIWDDQPSWDTPKPKTMELYRYVNRIYDERVETFEPDTSLYAFSFYSGGTPALENYKGRAAALLFKGDKTEIRQITNTCSLDSVNTDAFYADSIMWVFSRFDSPRIIPELVKDSTLRAYPVPWRGSGQLCFTPLPETKKFLEIRNGRGELVLREQYHKTTHCIEESRVREKMRPGVYRFRAGSSGKTQKFLVVY